MAPTQKSPRLDSCKEETGEKDDRKRVGKACDRCRLKKSKCDGQRPCNRCKTDDGICMYGERKKVAEKIYPKGYCDQLVADHNRLIKCIHILYGHCADAAIQWDYPKVEKDSNGSYLTHDILKAMDLLQHVDTEEGGTLPFEDEPATLLKRFREEEEVKRLLQGETKRECSTPSTAQQTPLQSHVSMSRSSSSQSSIQFGGSYSSLARSRQPHPIPPGIQTFGHTPNGGYAPPTPGQSPSNDISGFHFNMERRPSHQGNTMNQSSFLPQTRRPSFVSTPHEQPFYAQPYRPYFEPNNMNHTQMYCSAEQTTYIQGFGNPMGRAEPMQLGEAPVEGMDMAHGQSPLDSFTPQNQSQDPPLFDLPNTNEDWSATALLTGTDPVMGFYPSTINPAELLEKSPALNNADTFGSV